MKAILNAYEYLSSGGIIMIPIIFCSLWMWWLISQRLFYFRYLNKNDLNLHQAMEMLRNEYEPKNRKGLCAGILIEFISKQTKNKKLNQSILGLCIMKKRPFIRRSITTIAVLAAVAPLLGLLGTVTGMMSTFDSISLFGTGNPKAMAGGISVAMITTQSGLLAAIPGLFMSSFLSRRANSMENRLDELALMISRSF